MLGVYQDQGLPNLQFVLLPFHLGSLEDSCLQSKIVSKKSSLPLT